MVWIQRIVGMACVCASYQASAFPPKNPFLGDSSSRSYATKLFEGDTESNAARARLNANLSNPNTLGPGGGMNF